jgi:putative flippase GtrA
MNRLQRVTAFYINAQFGRFLVVGGIALVLHWLSRFVFNWFVGYGWAIVMAYLIGIAAAFLLNRVYVFTYSDQTFEHEALWFFLVNIAAFPMVWSVAYVLGDRVLTNWMPQQPAFAIGHAVAIVLPTFVNFALHKLITFRGA